MTKENKKPFKSKMRDFAIKVGEFVTDPAIRKSSRFATGILEVMSYVDKKNPVSVGTSILSAVDVALDSFELPYPTKTEHFAKKRSLEVKPGALPRILVDAGVTEDFENHIIFTDGTWAVRELDIGEGNQLYYAENTDTAVYYQDPLARYANSFYHTKGFDFDKLFDKLWSKYPNGVFISASSNAQRHWEGLTMALHDLTTEDCLYIGELDPKKFAEDIKSFREDETSRSFMLAGPPGTGKTSFVIEVARNISNRIVRIDPTVAHAFKSSEFEFLIENLQPDILVFDDFDRAAMAQDSEHLLFLLENIKYRFPKMIIFATVNYFDKLDKALVRPGRFDEILWFDLPSSAIRAKIAKLYLDLLDIKYDINLIKEIVEKTEGFSPVYIKELCIRVKHKGRAEIDKVIKEFKRVEDELDGSFSLEENSSQSDNDPEDWYKQIQLEMDGK